MFPVSSCPPWWLWRLGGSDGPSGSPSALWFLLTSKTRQIFFPTFISLRFVIRMVLFAPVRKSFSGLTISSKTRAKVRRHANTQKMRTGNTNSLPTFSIPPPSLNVESSMLKVECFPTVPAPIDLDQEGGRRPDVMLNSSTLATQLEISNSGGRKWPPVCRPPPFRGHFQSQFSRFNFPPRDLIVGLTR